MSALLAATSTLVFGGLVPGVASASPGTIKVGGFPIDNADGNANDPHLPTACVGVRIADMDTASGVTATFTTKNLKHDATTTMLSTSGTVAPFDLQNWLASLGPAPQKQGYHVKVDVAGKTKTFWVDDATKGCPGTTTPPVTNPLGANCKEFEFLKVTAPTNGTAVPGDTLTVAFSDESVLNMAAVVFTLDGKPVTPTFNPPTGGKVVTISYTLPTNVANGDHTAFVYAMDSDHVGDCGTATWKFTVNGGGSSCSANAQVLGNSLPDDPQKDAIAAGSGIGAVYQGSTPLDQTTAVFTIDGAQAPGPYYFVDNGDGTTSVYYVLPVDFAAGPHTITLQVGDPSTQCPKTWTFTSTAFGGSTT